jgi:NADPH-dependent ferric siderophore reductase
MTVTSVQPHLLLAAEVRAVERLGPSFVRITFGGEGFDQLGPEGPTHDQRIKLVFPTAGHPLPLHRLSAESWYADWLALPDADRGHVRTYTARSVQGEGPHRHLVVDFVIHEPSGPAATFAASASAGDVIGLLAPRRSLEDQFGGIEFRPGAARRLCFVADETAVPALASIIEALPSGSRGWAVAEVPEAGDVQQISTAADLDVEWIVRGGRPRGTATIEAVRRHWRLDAAAPVEQPARSDHRDAHDGNDTRDTDDADVWETSVFSSSGETVAVSPAEAAESATPGPEETYAWIAGDSDTVKAIRRILVGEVGMARHLVAFMGYWKVGTAQL